MTGTLKPLPSREMIAASVEYDPTTGVLTWCDRSNIPHWINRRLVGKQAGSLRDGYRQIVISGRAYTASRLAWLLAHGSWPPNEVDHINGDRDDNRLVNLRLASPSENGQNRGLRVDNSTGVMGVWKERNRWRASIRVKGKAVYLGRFSSAEAAGKAYLEAKRRYHDFQPTPRGQGGSQ